MALTMDERVAVTPARDTDLADLAMLQWRWRVGEWGAEAEVDEPSFSARLPEWAASHRDSHHAFIARFDGRPVGMAWLAVVERVPTPAHWTRLGGHLQSVYVVPELRNAEVGSALVRAVVERARALHLDYVMVHPSEKSFAFYRRHGFTETGRYLELELRD